MKTRSLSILFPQQSVVSQKDSSLKRKKGRERTRAYTSFELTAREKSGVEGRMGSDTEREI